MMKMKLLDMEFESEAAIRLAKDRLTQNDFIELVCPKGFLYVNYVGTIN